MIDETTLDVVQANDEEVPENVQGASEEEALTLEQLEALDDGNDENADIGEGSAKPKSWREVEIVQQVRFGFTPDVVDKALRGWKPVDKYCWILHDQDVYSDGKPKEPHIHLAIQFRNPTKTEQIINRFKKVSGGACQLAEQYLERIRAGYANACNYQTHVDEEAYKTRYDRKAIHCNFDYDVLVQKVRQKNVDKFTASMQKKLCEAIISGEIREYMLYNSAYDKMLAETYHLSPFNLIKYDSVIRKSLSAQYAREAGCSRHLLTLFIQGAPGIGKDVLANRIADAVQRVSYRCNGSDNPWDDYRGEPCVIWSDARDKSLKMQHFLAALDPYHRQSIASRYHDRVNLADLIMLTSSQNLRYWYSKAMVGDKYWKEDPSQLYRRIPFVLNVRYTDATCREKVVDVFSYDEACMNAFDRRDTNLEHAYMAAYKLRDTYAYKDIPGLFASAFIAQVQGTGSDSVDHVDHA